MMFKRWEHFDEWVSKHQKSIDRVNAKILEALQQYGPLNIKAVAESIGLPDTTVRFRIRKMIGQRLLLITAHLNFAKLGLARGFMIAEAPKGRHELVLEVIKQTDYWNYLARCYGKFDGYIAYFAFPAEHIKCLEEYLEEAANLKIFSKYLFFWITNTYLPYVSFEWYDFEKKQWNFYWDRWINEITNASNEIPRIIRDPEKYEILADKIDLLILKELEKNAMRDFMKLAKILGISHQTVHYRWHNHIIKRNLITQYSTAFKPYPFIITDFYLFIIDFTNQDSLAKFCNASLRKPFIISYAKIIGKNSLIVAIQIPKLEFSNLINALNSLYKKNLVENFVYVNIDLLSHERQTISYEFFENKKWNYNHEEKMQWLRKVANTNSKSKHASDVENF